jgi:HD-like signal output (HDOD) protein
MHDTNPTGAKGDRAIAAGDRDAIDQARVMREVIQLAPEAMTLEELIRELTIASTNFEERDRIRRAVRDLVAGGLLHRVGELVLPTRAAVNYYLLEEV